MQLYDNNTEYYSFQSSIAICNNLMDASVLVTSGRLDTI